MFLYTSGGIIVKNIWEITVVLFLLFTYFMAYKNIWTSRECTKAASFACSILFMWAIPLFIPLIYHPLLLIGNIYLSFKVNRADSKDLIADEARGVTSINKKIRKEQEHKWTLMTEKERTEWKTNYELSKPQNTPLWLLIVINLASCIVSNYIVRV